MSTRTLHIMRPYGHEHAGDQAVDLETDVDLARTLFEEAIANGMMAYVQKEKDGPREATRTFDPHAHNIVMRPQMVGG